MIAFERHGEVPQLTVMVITFNEEDNIARTLDSVSWADRILVIDSGSTDGTLAMISHYQQVEIMTRHFTTFAEQCNFGLDHITSEWVLSIDSDYVLPIKAQHSIHMAMMSDTSKAFQASFDYLVAGQAVKGSILPPRTVLYKKEAAHYVDDGHGHRVQIDGNVGYLPFRIAHDDRKSLSRWAASQISYARIEAEKLVTSSADSLSLQDRIRQLIVIAPGAVFLLVYLFRGAFLSGWRGLFYAGQRFFAELLLSLFLIDQRLANNKSVHSKKKLSS